MRTFLATSLRLLLAGLVVASLAAPAAGGPNVRHDEEAFADWFVPTGEKNEFKWFGAFVLRSTVLAGDGGWFSGAGFVKGHCTRERTPKYVSISCMGKNFVTGDPETDFEMSPLANEATLRVREEGETHRASWTSPLTNGGLYGYSEYCATYKPGEEEPEEEGEGQGSGIFNPATATGKFLGQRFSDPSKARWASLSTAVVVTTCSFRSVDYDPATSTMTVDFRIPR